MSPVERRIRGRRVIFEGRGEDANRSWVEYLRYSLDVFDERDNLVEVLGRLADLSVAHAAFESVCAKYPDKRIFLREKARVIRRYDEPRG
jgi:hypothetical protein